MAEPAHEPESPGGDPYLTDLAVRERRNAAFVGMIRDWLDDETGFEESTWPVLRASLERERAISDEAPLFDR